MTGKLKVFFCVDQTLIAWYIRDCINATNQLFPRRDVRARPEERKATRFFSYRRLSYLEMI